MIVLSMALSHKALCRLLLLVGVGLFVSDMVHHFVVLWLATGSPEFDIRYPGY